MADPLHPLTSSPPHPWTPSPTEAGDTLPTAGMARMMALDGKEDLWPDSDMADLLRHQLSAPVIADLRRSGAVDKATLSELERLSPGRISPSFGEVLCHPAAPLELLRAIKDFGKSAARNDGPLPSDIAHVLYYTSILAALLQHGQRISAMDDNSIRQGAEWVTTRVWLDQATRDLCDKGLAKLR